MPPGGCGVVRPACSAFGLCARVPPSAGEASAGARRRRASSCGARRGRAQRAVDGAGERRTMGGVVERRESEVAARHAAKAL